MKHFTTSLPIYSQIDSSDYVYHFYVETFCGSFVEVSLVEYMSILKSCRKFGIRHHVDVHEYLFRCYNIFLENK